MGSRLAWRELRQRATSDSNDKHRGTSRDSRKPNVQRDGVPHADRPPVCVVPFSQIGGSCTRVSPMIAVMTTTRRADMFTADGKPSDEDPREHRSRLGDERTALAEALRCQRLTLKIEVCRS